MAYRILVVDDSTTIQKIFKIAFSRHDALVIAAGSMIEAISEINRNNPDILVMDASLPGTKRPTDLKNIQEDAGNVPVLLLVGSHESFDESGFREIGMTHFLRKPFEAQDILRSMALVLGKEIPLKGVDEEDKTKPMSPSPVGAPTSSMPPPPPPPLQGGNLQMPPDNLPPLPDPQKFEFAEPGDPQIEPAPMTPEVRIEMEKRGRRVFSEEEQTQNNNVSSFSDPNDNQGQQSNYPVDEPTLRAERIEAPPPTIADEDGDLRDEIREKLEEFISAEAPVIVRKAVEAYCEKHFAEIAKSVLTAELRRLADEKSRLLVDS